MKHYWKYFKYVLKHKWHVYKAGRTFGVPILMLLWHDMDKFKWRMFKAYANYFYNFKNLPTDRDVGRANIVAGVVGWHPYTQEQCEHDFNWTWNQHQKRNRHHWQNAVRKDDDGTEDVMEMEENDWREMCADWVGAGAAIPNAKPLKIWYAETDRQLHPNTRRNVERLLGIEDYDVVDHS